MTSKGSTDLFASCESGMRWGYNRFKRDGVVMFEDKHKVFGEYETQTDCEAAAKNGFKYIEYNGREHKLSPASSQDESRFIGNCEKKTVDVCVKFEDVRLSSEILSATAVQ